MKKFIIYLLVILIGIIVFLLQFGYQRSYMPYTYYQVYLDNEEIGVIKSKKDFDKYVKKQGDLVKKQVREYNSEVNKIDNLYSIYKNTFKRSNAHYNNYYKLLNYQRTLTYIYSNVDEEGNIKNNNDAVVEYYSNLDIKYKGTSYLNKYKIENINSLYKTLNNEIKGLNLDLFEFVYQSINNEKYTETQKALLIDYKDNKLYDKDYTEYLKKSNYIAENKIYLVADNIYEPLGIYIKKINTYIHHVDDIEVAYERIISKKPCTVEGYQFRIKKSAINRVGINTLVGAHAQADYSLISNDNSHDILVYVTEEKVFTDAVKDFIKVFVGEEAYNNYINKTQNEIKDTGTKINNVYIEENITMKKTNISIKENIFSNSQDLASYLLYGDNKKSKIVRAMSTDNISDLAYKYGISIEEFFLSNPTFSSIHQMFKEGEEVTITQINPKITVVVEENQVIDKEVRYSIIEKYDNTMLSGNEYVEQQGSNGIVRVSQDVVSKNGSKYSVNLISNATIKSAKDKVVLVGTKIISTVGSTSSWGWPTCAGYTISSHFGYRQYPFGGGRELHAGIDIAGCKFGSAIYASNNGVIYQIKTEKWNYGKSIIIDHRNGYYTLYGHMNGFATGLKVGSTVSRGQVIGYMGHTGAATGTHLHFEIRVGAPKYSNVTNPYPFLMR